MKRMVLQIVALIPTGVGGLILWLEQSTALSILKLEAMLKVSDAKP
jgi:hypothetical protein